MKQPIELIILRVLKNFKKSQLAVNFGLEVKNFWLLNF